MSDSKASIAVSLSLQTELLRVESEPINPVRLEKAGLAEFARLANQI